MSQHENGLKVIFDGDVSGLNSEVLIANLISTANILQEVNKNLKGPKLEIYIKPFAPGSFTIYYGLLFSSVASGLVGSLSRGGLEYLIHVITQLFKLKQFLKGKKPVEVIQEGNDIRIKNNYGNVLVLDHRVVDQYKNSGPINDSLNKMFRTLEEEEKIDSFQLFDQDDKELFRADRTDFPGMRTKNEMLLEDAKEKTINNAILVVYRIVFAEDRKWAFVFQDTIISAYITDHAFFEHLNDYRFGNGDCIEADLKILQKYDEIAKAYINIDYEVVKIHKIEPRKEQKKLEFHKD